MREDYANYLNNVALCYYHKAADLDEVSDMEEALEYFIKAIAANSKNPIHYFNKGNVHM
jgi:tetratricopeptide (TPR) repeat protein